MSNPNSPAVVVEPQKLATYFRSDEMVSRFAQLMPSEGRARSYLTGVVLAVMGNDDLQKCSLQSIYVSAIRAASLGMSVDPSTKQAYLVPYGKQCTLIVGWKGLYDMAVRTGRYRKINVQRVYKGEVIKENRVTGDVWLDLTSNAPLDKSVTAGWIGYFKMHDGFEKTIYMTVEEIHAHGKRYSKTYSNPKGAWQTNPDEMERKTVMRMLLTKHGYLDPAEQRVLEAGEEIVNGADEFAAPPEIDTVIMAEAAKPKKSTAQLQRELGYDPEPADLEAEKQDQRGLGGVVAKLRSAVAGSIPAPTDHDDLGGYLAWAGQWMTQEKAEEIRQDMDGDILRAVEYIKETADRR